MNNTDLILETAYWNLRALSVMDFGRSMEGQYVILLQDTYSLLCNCETFYTYNANGYFGSTYDESVYTKNYLEPYMYTFKVMEKIDPSKFPTKPIRKFLAMYSVLPLSVRSFGVVCSKEGLPAPVDYNYSCSREWLKYPDSIKALGRKLHLIDWRFQNGQST